MAVSEAVRQKLLDDAVTAVKAWMADQTPRVPSDTYTHSQATMPALETMRLRAVAVQAVTAAVKCGHHHALIAARVQRPGLAVIELIDDADARAVALVREREAAQVYVDRVMYEIRVAAVGRVLAAGGKDKTATAELFGGISRVTLDRWLAEHEAGTAPVTPWEDAGVN